MIVQRLIKSSTGIALAVAEIPASTVEKLLADPAGLLAVAVAPPIKEGRSTFLVKTRLPEAGEHRPLLAYKQIRQPVWWKRVLDPLRKRRALSAWHCGHTLIARGISTPRPLYAIVPRRWQFGRPSYLAVEWIDGGLDLHRFFLDVRNLDPQAQHRRLKSAAQSLAELLARMHREKITNRDLKAGNVLLLNREEHVEAYLVDLDGVGFPFWLPDRVRWKNLSRLVIDLRVHPAFTQSLQLRFLRAYLQAASMTDTDWKRIWRSIARFSANRRRRRCKR